MYNLGGQMKSELMKFIYSKKSIGVFLSIIIIVLTENIVIFRQAYINLSDKKMFNKFTDVTFLSAYSEGHIFQIILFWFLPIFMLLMYSDKVINEIKTAYVNTAIIKHNKKKYIYNKIKVGFLIGFCTIFIALTMNFILSFILFNGGEYTRFSNKNIEELSSMSLRAWQILNPVITNYIYIVIVSFFSGICMIMTTLLSFVIGDKKIVYILSFFSWFILVTRSKNSLMFIFQPFTEFDLNYQINTFNQSIIYFLIISAILMYIVRKRRDYV